MSWTSCASPYVRPLNLAMFGYKIKMAHRVVRFLLKVPDLSWTGRGIGTRMHHTAMGTHTPLTLLFIYSLFFLIQRLSAGRQ